MKKYCINLCSTQRLLQVKCSHSRLYHRSTGQRRYMWTHHHFSWGCRSHQSWRNIFDVALSHMFSWRDPTVCIYVGLAPQGSVPRDGEAQDSQFFSNTSTRQNMGSDPLLPTFDLFTPVHLPDQDPLAFFPFPLGSFPSGSASVLASDPFVRHRRH